MEYRISEPELNEFLSVIESDHPNIMESFQDVYRMFQREDEGWLSTMGGILNRTIGIELGELKKIANDLRPRVVGNPLIKRGVALRTSYVFSKGVNVPDVARAKVSRGRPSASAKFYRNPVNEANVWSPAALERFERSAATEGMVLLIGDEKTKTLRPVPLAEIAAVMTNPDFGDEVWAYKRQWTTMKPDGSTDTEERWIYLDTYTGKIPASVDSVPVDRGSRAIDIRFNTQVGSPFGMPDGVAAATWSRLYSEAMDNGLAMTRALARYAAKVTTGNKTTAKNVGATMAKRGAGNVAVGEDITPLTSAGKTYDFNGIRPIAAMVATTFEVSIVHLLSDPGAAGSSYGSASNLDLPTKRAMVSRQNLWTTFFNRIIRWGTGSEESVSFPPLDDPDPYREGQMFTLVWNSGLVHPDEMRAKMLELADITPLHDEAPDWSEYPTLKPDLAAGLASGAEAGGTGQGENTGTGGTDKTLNNDTNQEIE